METIILTWTEPQNVYALKGFVNERYKGVYIWGFNIDNFIPYYVGVSNNIIRRLFGHINFIIGGKYTIFHKNSLNNIIESKKQGLQKDRTKGIIYLPNWPAGYTEFIKDKEILNEHIDFMIDKFVFSFAPVLDDKSKTDLEEIEKICINKIGLERLGNTKAGKANPNYEIMHLGCEIIKKILD